MFALVPAPAQAQTTPMLCWGNVTLDGAAAPVGTIVDIFIGSDTTPSGSWNVTTAGQYGAINVWGLESRYGEPLKYSVNGSEATKLGPGNGTFGLQNQVVNLEAFSSTPITPTPTVTPTPTPPLNVTPTPTPTIPPTLQIFQLQTSVLPQSSAGSVYPSSGPYLENVTIALTAVPASGWVFNSWSGDTSGSLNPKAVIMTSNKAIVANFAPIATPTPTPTSTPSVTPTATPTPTPTTTPPPFEGEGTVGVSAGTVTTNDSKVSLDFPAGAFTSNTTVTIKSASCPTAPEGYTVQNTCFSISTSPSVAELLENATIQVKYSTADWNAADKDPDRLKLAYYSGGEWNLLDTTVSTASVTVSAQTTHLSEWAVLAEEAGSAWQWWYTLLIVMGVLIIIAVVALFVITRSRGAAEDYDDGDLYIDDEEF
jgi:hypothetical protein